VRPYWLRAAALLFYFDFVTPFGFAWLKPEMLLVNSFFGIDKTALGLVLASVALFIFWEGRRYRAMAFLPLLLALDLSVRELSDEGQIVLAGTDYAQDEKWNRANLDAIVAANMEQIDRAIGANKAAVVLPESVFPLYLNYYPRLIETLKEKSRYITIIAGGLFSDGTEHFNSTYFFQNGEMEVAHKVVLVPFGESTEFLPRWLGRYVNAIFFDGAEDYRTAREPTDFEIGGKRYRNAICYEATVERMYENAPSRMIAITNNAWYHPSTEPALQRVVIRYFARKHGVIVYHAVNKSRSEIIY
jgi:apolipoprotein N-acyltransferase